jgi:hypothetical protein
MTFYNVVSGILFLGACQTLLRTIGLSSFWPAATLAVVIFNDSINTSETIEREDNPRRAPYTVWMKLLDLLAFMLVGLALMAIDLVRNPFGVDVNLTLPSLAASSVFWLLLTAYWICLILWNFMALQFDNSKWKPWAQCLCIVTLLPFVACAWASAGRYDFRPVLAGRLAFIWMLTYLLVKPLGRVGP